MDARLLPPAFNDFFAAAYGDRWPRLLQALGEPDRQVLRPVNAPISAPDEITWLRDCLWFTPDRSEMAHSRSDSGLLNYYILDPASVLAARALGARPGETILDMCASPGGKSLILHQALEGSGQLIANEISSGRRERLKKVFQQYLARENRENLSIQGKDGLKYGVISPGRFDRILVDAPCSGERHLLGDAEELKDWTPKRSENLAKRQYGLLTSALLALRPGGILVYSTCSISPLENDGVVDRLLERKGDSFEIDPIEELPSPFAERTRHGVIHLPDRGGFGPLYFARLIKKVLS